MDTYPLQYPPQLPIARYRFRFAITRTLHSPAYAGSALRGAFGHALRRASLPRGHQKDPLLLQHSPYVHIFETPPRPDIGLANPATIPNPYVIEPESIDDQRDYPPGSAYHFNMVLLGQARHYLPLISYAWQQAFASASGIAKGQGELENIAVEENGIWHDIYEEGRIIEHNNTLQLPRQLATRATLHIHTPLRLQHNGKGMGVAQLNAQILLTHLLRRLSLVSQIHLNHNPQADYAALKTRAAAVQSQADLQWYDWKRYSNRQQQSMHLGGVIGRWQLANLTPEHALALYLGQWLHIGKNTTFGLGGYTLEQHP